MSKYMVVETIIQEDFIVVDAENDDEAIAKARVGDTVESGSQIRRTTKTREMPENTAAAMAPEGTTVQ